MALEPRPASQQKQYDYLLKFLLVGDSDVGKQEILSGLEDGSSESPFCSGSAYKTTTILLDGKRVKLQLWDTSGQGRFLYHNTLIFSRGAGHSVVYTITSKTSLHSICRMLRSVADHAPGVPKVLVGNRLHLAFKRQVRAREAETYAAKNHMAFFEVSPLCDFNIRESFSELSRMALHRNGMERLWRSNKVLSLQELCCRSIVARTTVYGIDQLPLPTAIKSYLRSYAMTSTTMQHRYVLNHVSGRSLAAGRANHKKLKFVSGGGVSSSAGGIVSPSGSSGSVPRMDSTRTSCAGRNSCTIS
ncbi:hypothetical protein PR048_002911 [Dryococelus australis]|uniref:SOCS box domain-containing protein n=1 Tax=Dryococelus australis TaxID=614101 RepID=A0ABQ9IM37_9NEOP|nr:hypothetical protein PR048_002911 [Dryococelus australis]